MAGNTYKKSVKVAVRQVAAKAVKPLKAAESALLAGGNPQIAKADGGE